ncbi:MAG: ankyrin repeat domain-containing protein [Synergistaceae bacterium]|nr:ankyrin repeat domain-containing protein [Synergistaceae bacterium]
MTQEELNKKLIYTSARGNTEQVRELLDAGADPNTKDNDGHTALIEAAWRGKTETVRLLLDRGADPNIRNSYGSTALSRAVRNGFKRTANLLIEKGTDLDLNILYDGWNVLMLAALHGYPDIMETLIKAGADPGFRDNLGRTAFDILKENHPKMYEKWQREVRIKNLKLEDSIRNSADIPDWNI